MQKLIFEEKIYTYHIDIVGHVNNIIYIQWMENGSVKLLEAIGLPVTEIDKRGILPVLQILPSVIKSRFLFIITLPLKCGFRN